MRAGALRSGALALLDGGVLAVLRDGLGTIEVAGSVALDLMVWPDIDLYARLEPGEASRLLAVLPRLAESLARAGQPVERVAFRDEHLQRDPAFPDSPGLYLGVTTCGASGARRGADPGARGWKLDLWAWDAARYAPQHRCHAELAAKLARADRDVVLRLKAALWDQPGYRSADVYAFALADAGSSLEDFERFRSERSASRKAGPQVDRGSP